MSMRTSVLAAGHLLAATGLAFFAGVFSGRSGVIQFFGHLGPAMLFACAGLMGISGWMDTRRLIRVEAYVALGAAALYLLVDSFIIHPPFGIFDGAGVAEQQHVSLNLMLVGLAAFVLLTMRYTQQLPSIQVMIAAGAFAVVFSAHEQHSAVTALAHDATTAFVILAAVLRLFDRMFEYGVALLISAHTFFAGQVGLARFAEDLGIDPAAWSAYWITAACLAAAAYVVAMRERPGEIFQA